MDFVFDSLSSIASNGNSSNTGYYYYYQRLTVTLTTSGPHGQLCSYEVGTQSHATILLANALQQSPFFTTPSSAPATIFFFISLPLSITSTATSRPICPESACVYSHAAWFLPKPLCASRWSLPSAPWLLGPGLKKSVRTLLALGCKDLWLDGSRSSSSSSSKKEAYKGEKSR